MSKIQGLPPPDISPDKTIPLPTPTPSSSPPNIPSLEALRSWIPLYLKKSDRTVDRLNTILSTPSGTDILLLTLCYSSLLSSTVLSSISLRRLHKVAREIIKQAISLPPNTTVIIDTSTIPPSQLLITAERLRALSSLISDFRIFARLWGLLGIYKWGKEVLEKPDDDLVVRRIVYGQVLVNIFYQYLENGAYLSSKGVLGWNTERQNKAWVWSSRFWMAHVGLEFVRLYHEWVTQKQWESDEERRTDGPKGDVSTGKGKAEWRARWTREMLVNAAYAPLTLHWSLEKGLMEDFWVGLLGSVAGIARFTVLWRDA